MATAFSPQERAAIDAQLRAAALRCAATLGMRKTTVEELARQAGISKGAFYHFYQSKEHLFLSTLESLHDEMYGNAEKIIAERRDLPIARRTALAIGEVCRIMEERNMMGFMSADLPVLLRRVPEDMLRRHYQSDEVRIQRMVERAGVVLDGSMERACTVVRILLQALTCRSYIGPGFDEGLRVLIDGACDRLVEMEK